MKQGWFAAVGTDGMRLVVWGLGKTEAAALTDAAAQKDFAGQDVETHAITAEQVEIVRAGDVRWPIDGASEFYTFTGRSLVLTEATSRKCGHLAEIDGETPDGSASAEARRVMRRHAEHLASTLGKSIEIYASHPSCQDWVVAVVEPGPVNEELERANRDSRPGGGRRAVGGP